MENKPNVDVLLDLNMNIYDQCDEYYDCYIRITPQSNGEDIVEWSETQPFDQLEGTEVREGCFVQVLTNTVTGDVSVGWIPSAE